MRSRISRDGRTVRCGVATCGGVFGWLHPSGSFELAPGFIWNERLSALVLSQHAIRRRGDGHGSGWRRAPKWAPTMVATEGPRMVCPMPRCKSDGAPQEVDVETAAAANMNAALRAAMAKPNPLSQRLSL